MKRLFISLFTFVGCFAFSLQLAVAAGDATENEKIEFIDYNGQKLPKSLLSKWCKNGKCANNELDMIFEMKDLNSDGKPEYVVKFKSLCGSSGCDGTIYGLFKNEWKNLLPTIGDEDRCNIRILTSKTKGYQDVACGKRVMKWDGKSYK